MKKIFITYGDLGYEKAKNKIVSEAKMTGEFTDFYAFDRKDLSHELLTSSIINIKRGGGLWSWKPDVILSTMKNYQLGDYIVYCDAGCSIYLSNEWKNIWNKLDIHDIIVQRSFHKSYKWTRREIIEYVNIPSRDWLFQYQYLATVIIIKISDFTLKLIEDWRNIMINSPQCAMDVGKEQLLEQHSGFIENRHDQAIYSALIYKYLNNNDFKNRIYTQWERFENYDFVYKQAIRATRLRLGQKEKPKVRFIAGLKRLIKDFILKPFYYSPIQWWYGRNK